MLRVLVWGLDRGRLYPLPQLLNTLAGQAYFVSFSSCMSFPRFMSVVSYQTSVAWHYVSSCHGGVSLTLPGPSIGREGAAEAPWNLAVKMMFNYDAESNACSILRAMYREVVPAPLASVSQPIRRLVAGSVGSGHVQRSAGVDRLVFVCSHLRASLFPFNNKYTRALARISLRLGTTPTPTRKIQLVSPYTVSHTQPASCSHIFSVVTGTVFGSVLAPSSGFGCTLSVGIKSRGARERTVEDSNVNAIGLAPLFGNGAPQLLKNKISCFH